MNTVETYPVRSDTTAWRTFDEQAVIVLPEEGKVKVLNTSGSRIWELCDGAHSVLAIIGLITDEFSVDPREAEEDVTEFVNDFAVKGLLVLESREKQ